MQEADRYDEIVARVLRVFPATRSVVLFGSHARGTERADSDIDLLVVVPTELRPAERGARIGEALWDLGVATDIVVVTPEELERLREWRSSVVAHAIREGRVLHEAA